MATLLSEVMMGCLICLDIQKNVLYKYIKIIILVVQFLTTGSVLKNIAYSFLHFLGYLTQKVLENNT